MIKGHIYAFESIPPYYRCNHCCDTVRETHRRYLGKVSPRRLHLNFDFIVGLHSRCELMSIRFARLMEGMHLIRACPVSVGFDEVHTQLGTKIWCNMSVSLDVYIYIHIRKLISLLTFNCSPSCYSMLVLDENIARKTKSYRQNHININEPS